MDADYCSLIVIMIIIMIRGLDLHICIPIAGYHLKNRIQWSISLLVGHVFDNSMFQGSNKVRVDRFDPQVSHLFVNILNTRFNLKIRTQDTSLRILDLNVVIGPLIRFIQSNSLKFSAGTGLLPLYTVIAPLPSIFSQSFFKSASSVKQRLQLP